MSTTDRGFTLTEVLVALALLTVGIIGVGAALTAQTSGLSSGAAVGLAAVSRANYSSTATMLAQERIEQMKVSTYSATGPVDQITAANFPDEAYGGIGGYPNFRRTVTIQNATPAANMKTVTVNVFYRPPTDLGTLTEESVQLMTIIAQRP